MRRGRDNGVLEVDGVALGFNLGADFTAEHEWGIKELQSDFGIPFGDDTKLGIEKRTVTNIPAGLVLKIRSGSALLLYVDHTWVRDEAERVKRLDETCANATKRGELSLHGDKLTASAWDAKSFGIYTKDPKVIPVLIDLYSAFQRKDVAIWLGGGGVFQNAGLVLGIVSRLPAAKIEVMRAADEDRIKLLAAAQATGIEEQLRKAGKQWFALSPRWKLASTAFGDVTTKYPVMFWLNPMQQDIHNSGWFTVEQLQEWVKGKGPVMGGRRARESRA